MECSKAGFPVLHYLPEFAQTQVHWVNDAIPPSHPLSPPSPPVLNPSRLKAFSNESAVHIRWPKYWSFSIRPSNEYSGLIYLGLTGLISLLSKGLSRVFSSISVRKHQFFSTQPPLWVQLSHPNMTTGKTIALTRVTFIGKVTCLLFNMLSGFVRAFLPRIKCHCHGCSHLPQWFWSPRK